jgi:hypothetical protein
VAGDRIKENMINAYFIIPLVVGIVLTYLWLIHRLWLRSVFSEYDKPTVDTKIVGRIGISASQTSDGSGKIIAAQIDYRTMKARTE